MGSGPLDLLSDVLPSARPRSWVAEECSFLAPWGLRAGRDSATFYHLVQGQAWLEVEGIQEPIKLTSGDFILVMAGHEHTLRDSPGSHAHPLEEVFGDSRKAHTTIDNDGEAGTSDPRSPHGVPSPSNGSIRLAPLASRGVSWRGQELAAQERDFPAERQLSQNEGISRPPASGESATVTDGILARLVCGGFDFDSQRGSLLLASLPPFLLVRGVQGQAVPWLDETLRLLTREAARNQAGRQAVVDHLGQVLFISAIRTCVETLGDQQGNWLAGLVDPQVSQALKLMHTRPDWPWTVATLASRVSMSRSVFATRFKALVGKPPLQYLADCRMGKACDLLGESQYGLKQIATRVGYATSAAFSKTFKRWSGVSPGAYRRRLLLDGALKPSRRAANPQAESRQCG